MKIATVNRTKDQARMNYNRLSRYYDVLAGSFEERYRDVGLKLMKPRSGETILEIAYGTGGSLIKIASMMEQTGKVHGIDISEGMYRETMKKVTKHNLDDMISPILGDATHLPYEKDLFDAVFISFALELFTHDQIHEVLQQVKKVIKQDGRLVIVSLIKSEAIACKVYESLHFIFPVLLDCRPIYLDHFVRSAGYTVQKQVKLKMFGLPVGIVRATQ